MAIQISEKHLSPEAKKALSNAKSKSQFLRDAVEFYVKKELSTDEKLREDIKHIKEILSQITLEPKKSIKIKNENKQSPSFSEHKEENDKEIIEEERKKETIKEAETEENKKPEKIEEENNDSMSSEERAEIEKMLDQSLDVF